MFKLKKPTILRPPLKSVQPFNKDDRKVVMAAVQGNVRCFALILKGDTMQNIEV